MKKENFLIWYIKSFIIGFGILLPISASMLAMSLGMYNRILDLINNLKDNLKNNFKFILALFLGLASSAVVSVLIINALYSKYHMATLLLFIGLIIGGFPVILKKVKGNVCPKNIFWLVIGFAILFSLAIMRSSADATISLKHYGPILIFLIGALAAGSMIIPGVSGSAILVTIGYYEPMIKIVSDTVKLKSLSVNIPIIIIFILGMIIGIIIVSKIMNFFLKKFETKSYFAILGFVSASIINLFMIMCSYPFNTVECIIGIILLLFGFIVSFKYLKED